MTNDILWRQFASAIGMLERAIHACPDELWSDPSRPPEWKDDDVVGFWYVVYHTLFWLDCYLTGSREGFAPPEPFNLDEFDPAGTLPERAYSKAELLDYLDHGREKCRVTIAALTAEKAARLCEFPWVRLSFGELLLDNMRHVQHHTAQLNLILRQNVQAAPGWIATTNRPLTPE